MFGIRCWDLHVFTIPTLAFLDSQLREVFDVPEVGNFFTIPDVGYLGLPILGSVRCSGGWEFLQFPMLGILVFQSREVFDVPEVGDFFSVRWESTFFPI